MDVAIRSQVSPSIGDHVHLADLTSSTEILNRPLERVGPTLSFIR